jgi:hypothetical protein
MNIFRRRCRLAQVPTHQLEKRIECTGAEFEYHAAITHRFRRINGGMFVSFASAFVSMLQTYPSLRSPLSFSLVQNKEVYAGRRISFDCLDEGKEIPINTLDLWSFLVHFYSSQTLVLIIRSQTFVAKVEWTHLRPRSLFFFAMEYPGHGKKRISSDALKKHLLQYMFLSRHVPMRHKFRIGYGMELVERIRRLKSRRILQLAW